MSVCYAGDRMLQGISFAEMLLKSIEKSAVSVSQVISSGFESNESKISLTNYVFVRITGKCFSWRVN